MKKEFVPYKQALALKELGFNEPCFGWWFADEEMLIIDKSTKSTSEKIIQAPLFQQAFRWFREKHDLVHRINRDGGYWICAILDLYDEEDQGAIEEFIDCYPDTYEEAELVCLKKLIEIVKGGNK
jgi:hypothetical protein